MSEKGSYDEQDLWIAEATKNVKKCSYYLRKAIDEDNMQEALRHSAALLGELRTSLLGPQKYYELYMQANDELRGLESFFSAEHSKGRAYADLYELVQHAGNVLPRLYLLCIVGACYIRSMEAPAKDLLRDMSEMCKGVQHPTRGLFLRAYLVQVCRGLLPDTGSRYEGPEGGSVLDAVDFLLTNFTEMNKLWVRMRHQGPERERERREKERAQLSDLVGKNLTQLSQLDGLTFELYRDTVLPRVLQQVVSCKDELAQGYLMQCVAAVFPDDFHVGTLEALVGTLPQLQPGVKLAAVMGALLERLAKYASQDPAVVAQLDAVAAFSKLSAAAARSVQEHPDMAGADLAALYSGLLLFAGAVYPQRLDFVDSVLETCHSALAPRGTIANTRAERQVVSLLSAPLDRYPATTVLALPHFQPLTALLPPPRRRDLARRVVEAVLSSKGADSVGSVEQVELLFGFIAPLVRDQDGVDADEEEVEEDSALVARLVHALRSPETDVQYQIVEAVLQKLLQGGPARTRHTLPPLAFVALQSVRSVAAAGEGKAPSPPCERWYRFLHRVASAFADARAAETALQLFLAAAQSASEEARLELMAYECFEQAFMLYEEGIPDSKQQVWALASMVGALHRCRVFGGDNRGALVAKAAAYCSKLLRRQDQCTAILSCSHLHWQEQDEAGGQVAGPPPELDHVAGGGAAAAGKAGEEEDLSAADAAGRHPPVRDAPGVLSCLRRALKVAHAAQQQLAVAPRRGDVASVPGHLFVEILNKYLYFFDRGVAGITPEVVNSVLELAASEVSTEACREDAALQAFYLNTLDAAQRRRAGGTARYDALKL